METRITINKENPNDLTIDELLVSTTTFDKIFLDGILEHIMPEELMKTIFSIKSKLNIAGKLVIQGYDLYELCYGIVNDRIPTVEFNKLIQDRKQLLCIPDIIYILNQLGFKILARDVDSLRFLVEAQLV